MNGHTAWVTSVDFSQDGKRALSAAGGFNHQSDTTVRVWAVDDASVRLAKATPESQPAQTKASAAEPGSAATSKLPSVQERLEIQQRLLTNYQSQHGAESETVVQTLLRFANGWLRDGKVEEAEQRLQSALEIIDRNPQRGLSSGDSAAG
jgi:WD40 repeat protein